MKDMILRRGTDADSDFVRNLVFSILKEYGLEPDPGSTDADLDAIEEFYIRSGGDFFVCENSDGEIIASTGLYPLNSSTCELRKMYIHPSWRGMGLGKKLLERSIQRAGELGFKDMTLETASVLKEAIGLYKRYGFKEYKPHSLSERCDRAYILSLVSPKN